MEEQMKLDLSETDKTASGPPGLRLVARLEPSEQSGPIYLTPECTSIDEFERVVEALKGQMDAAVAKAREVFSQHEAENEEPGYEPQTAEEIWRVLEGGNRLDEMRSFFNALELCKRQEVADYVFSRLNIFKGAASLFSQHYNRETCLLEEEG